MGLIDMSKDQSQQTYDAFKQLTLICDKLIKSDRNTVFFIDLDSTLFDVSPRNQAIVRAFSAEPAYAQFPQIKKLTNCVCYPGEYGYNNSLHRVGVDNANLLDFLKAYWKTHFFTDRFLKHDKVYAGAIDFIDSLAKHNSPFYFLSGRHHDEMINGTKNSLKSNGIIISDEKILLKKNPLQADGEFKKDKVFSFNHSFKKFVFIDNEPVVINAVAKLKDKIDIEIIFFDTCHSQKELVNGTHHTIKVF